MTLGLGVSLLSFAPALAPTTYALQIPVMVYLDPVAVVAEGVPWWVILLAVLAGLLVLALLVLLMWKVRAGAGWGCGRVRFSFLAGHLHRTIVLTATYSSES